MGLEIERKFVVNEHFPYAGECGEKLPDSVEKKYITQGYFKNGDVRVRVLDRYYSDSAFLTIKGERDGMMREEFEYSIPVSEAWRMIELFCEDVIQKTRYIIKEEGRTWEVDVFEEDNKGLILAEVELATGDEDVVLPYFVGKEVTDDNRYYNKNLAKNPYSKWRRLHTSYFNSGEWETKDVVSIAGKSPEWYHGAEYKKLAPSFWFFEKYKRDGDKAFYTEQYYKEVLNKLDPKEVYYELGRNTVLLCWEKPGEFCHRHIVAEWLTNALNIEVTEIGEE